VERVPVDVCHEPAERFRDRLSRTVAHSRRGLQEERFEAVGSSERRAELVAVLLRHAVQPVEPRRIRGGNGRERGGGGDELRQERRRRERMWPAARPADDVESVESEPDGDRRDVVHAVGDGAAATPRGAGVART